MPGEHLREILTPTLVEILTSEYVRISSRDRLLDLGSGRGKAVASAVLLTPLRRATGVELASERHGAACRAFEWLRVDSRASSEFTTLESINADMFKLDWSRFSVVLISGLCFRPPMLLEIRRRLEAQLEPGARVVALRRLPTPVDAQETLRLVLHARGRMSWGLDSIYVYEKRQTISRRGGAVAVPNREDLLDASADSRIAEPSLDTSIRTSAERGRYMQCAGPTQKVLAPPRIILS